MANIVILEQEYKSISVVTEDDEVICHIEGDEIISNKGFKVILNPNIE